ncbi:phenylalanine--tRNA ligase, B5 domain protein, partial [Bordetella holmesii H620]
MSVHSGRGAGSGRADWRAAGCAAGRCRCRYDRRPAGRECRGAGSLRP